MHPGPQTSRAWAPAMKEPKQLGVGRPVCFRCSWSLWREGVAGEGRHGCCRATHPLGTQGEAEFQAATRPACVRVTGGDIAFREAWGRCCPFAAGSAALVGAAAAGCTRTEGCAEAAPLCQQLRALVRPCAQPTRDKARGTTSRKTTMFVWYHRQGESARSQESSWPPRPQGCMPSPYPSRRSSRREAPCSSGDRTAASGAEKWLLTHEQGTPCRSGLAVARIVVALSWERRQFGREGPVHQWRSLR
mmetsp:Transcript_38522/g.110162  ORF Transcript_38522/g.110162 Transcript_38522/m.110162 type:complete len:247 (-) Transcript_38522:1390-2130(-)